ncbi:MAG: tetratricopeptide repeat protein [Planctomycetota bacterium]
MADAAQLYDEADQLKAEGDMEGALSKLTEAVALDEGYALAYSALAVVCQKLGKHDEAIGHAQKVCELEPDDPFSFTAMSVTYQRAYAGTNEMKYIQLAEEAMEQSRILSQR